MQRLSAKLLLAGLALAMLGAVPAMAAAKKKPMHHAAATSTDMTADQLNAQSLSAAQQGKAFMPAASSAPAAPAPAQKKM